jgi:hypothetical protein
MMELALSYQCHITAAQDHSAVLQSTLRSDADLRIFGLLLDYGSLIVVMLILLVYELEDG